MLKLITALISICCLASIQAAQVKKRGIVDKGDHILVCKQEPIEIGIILDSSSSINNKDFDKAREFLVNFLNQFEIGSGKNDVRVSLITYGRGVYPKYGFNLNTYSTKAQVLDHFRHLVHKAAPYTDTGKAIKYMRQKQLNNANVRPHAEKISIVITDGNSQRWSFTKDQAKLARAQNITMFAVGIGTSKDVKQRELLNIAGDASRVTRVDSFDDLDSIKRVLATKTCIRKEKPTTTTPKPKEESCGKTHPTDIEFIFSRADMGIDETAWSTSFISNILRKDDLKDGFRYGVRTGNCPTDEGFALDAYNTIDAIKDRLAEFEKPALPSLIDDKLFSAARGGRSNARDIAVIFSSGSKKGKKGDVLKNKIQALIARGVKVYIANPAGFPAVKIKGATGLSGRGSRFQSEMLINDICPKKN